MLKITLAAAMAVTFLPQLASAGCCQVQDFKQRYYCIAAASEEMCRTDKRFKDRQAQWVTNAGCINRRCVAGKPNPITPYIPNLASAMDNPHEFKGTVDTTGGLMELEEEAYASLVKSGSAKTESGLILTERGAMVTLTPSDQESVQKYGALLINDAFMVSYADGAYILTELSPCENQE